MKSGDILLFKAGNEDWVSKLIAWGTNSKYSHVAVCVSSDLDIAIEANTTGGVRAIAVSEIVQSYDVYRVKEENQYDTQKLLAFLVKKLNDKYDYKGVFYLGLLKLIAKKKKNFKNKANKWQKDNDYFCSELCYEAFNFAGLDIVPEVDMADITAPGDIAKSSIIDLIEEK